jgi:hypothetical protein
MSSPRTAPLFDAAFLNGPDWRWKAAARQVDADAPSDVDQDVRDAAHYLAAFDADGEEAANSFPLVAAACAAWQLAAVRRAILLGALADCPVERVAQRLALDAPVVELIERLFCEVRPRRQASDWIHVHVLAPLLREGEAERVVECRASLFGGAAVAEAILNGDGSVSWRRAEGLGATEDRLRLKLAAALEMPLTPANSLQFVRLTLDYDAKMQALELAKQRFAHTCEAAQQKRQQAQERQAAAERRKEAAAAEAVQADALRESRRIAEALAAEQQAAASPLLLLQWRASDLNARQRLDVPHTSATPTLRTLAADAKKSRRSPSARGRNQQWASAV